MARGHTLILGDTHFPFANDKAINRAIAMAEGARHVVQVGDLYDQYAFSKYPVHLRELAETELDRGRNKAEWMWAQIRKRAPRAKLWQLIGNHDTRISKRVSERFPELQSFVNFRQWWEFPGVTTIHDPREEHPIGDAIFQHGHKSKLGDHALFNRQNTVCGHSHRGGVVFFRRRQGSFWELNAGWLGDESHHAFTYPAQKTTGWTLGVGVIDASGPRFVPF